MLEGLKGRLNAAKNRHAGSSNSIKHTKGSSKFTRKLLKNWHYLLILALLVLFLIYLVYTMNKSSPRSGNRKTKSFRGRLPNPTGAATAAMVGGAGMMSI